MDFAVGGRFQFEGARLDPISPAVTPVELLVDDKVFGHGTGFIWKHQEHFFFITNWHNFSGQHPFEGHHLNEAGRIPDAIRFFPSIGQKAKDNSQRFYRQTTTMRLFEHFERPEWRQHKRFDDLRIDIAVMELPTLDNEYVAINRFPDEPSLFTHVAQIYSSSDTPLQTLIISSLNFLSGNAGRSPRNPFLVGKENQHF